MKAVPRSWKLGIAGLCWLALVAVMFLWPGTSHGAEANMRPPAIDPGEWFKDANLLFRVTAGELQKQRADKQADNATTSVMRTRCLMVAMEYNKRARTITTSGKPRPVKQGKDAEGEFVSYTPPGDFFEKRSLPRLLDASECQP